MKEKTLYDIFSIAIKKERQAQELYAKAAELSKGNDKLQKRFLKFMQDEKKHEEGLIRDYAEFKKLMKMSD